jgi:hypothetical protein
MDFFLRAKRLNYVGQPCGCGCGKILAINFIVTCFSCEKKSISPDHNNKIMPECRNASRFCLKCQEEAVAVVEEKEVNELKNKKLQVRRAVSLPKELNNRKKSKSVVEKESLEASKLENGEQNLEYIHIYTYMYICI